MDKPKYLQKRTVGNGVEYSFYCPGCRQMHTFPVRPGGWKFNGNFDRPSFFPSLLYATKKPRCHLNLVAGQIHYCSDCDHELVGQTVLVPNLREVKGI